jgi:hypothetical protein
MALGLIVALGSGIGLADAGPPPNSEASELLRSTHIANQVGTGRFVQEIDGSLFMVAPSLVSNPITLVLAALALLAPGVRREAGTLFVAAVTGTVLLVAFNPILTPRLADLLVPIQGLGMLTRATWLLPIPYVLPAFFGALERRSGKSRLWQVVAAILLLGAAQLPAFSSSVDSWRTRRIPWDGSERVVLRSATDMPGLEGVHEALAAVAQPDDTALAPPPVARRIPAHVPNVRLLEFRGILGDLPHYPPARAAESLVRAEDVNSFWRPQAQLTANDSRILADHNVRFIVMPGSDGRIESLSELGYVVIFRSDSWTLLASS